MLVMSRSRSRIAPDVTAASPESRLISVDLPAPFGPMTAWTSSRCTAMETPDTAFNPP